MNISDQARKPGYNYDECAFSEGERLRTQAKLLADTDKPIYERVLAKYPEAVVLDIGCNEGDSAHDRFNDSNVKLYIGVDISEAAVTNAREKYEGEAARFFRLDLTHPNASRDLSDILRQCGAEQADIINISLMLLHLAEPKLVLEKLYPFLKRGGTILIKDIDDRDNIAVPDSARLFERSYAIAMANRDSGNRNIGREIPSWLKSCGYRDVSCLMKGICSRGMSEEQKRALWDIYYGFFKEDSAAECRYTDGSEQALYNLGWCEYYLPQMYELFMRPSSSSRWEYVFTRQPKRNDYGQAR